MNKPSCTTMQYLVQLKNSACSILAVKLCHVTRIIFANQIEQKLSFWFERTKHSMRIILKHSFLNFWKGKNKFVKNNRLARLKQRNVLTRVTQPTRATISILLFFTFLSSATILNTFLDLNLEEWHGKNETMYENRHRAQTKREKGWNCVNGNFRGFGKTTSATECVEVVMRKRALEREREREREREWERERENEREREWERERERERERGG